MRTSRLFGLDFVTDTSVDEVAAVLDSEGRARSSDWRVVVTPNVDHLVHYRRSPAERRVAEAAHMVLPDGAPVIWASRLLNSPIDRRIAGSEVFAKWWQRMVAAQRPVLVVAGNDALAHQLTTEHAGCRCIVPPVFDVEDSHAVAALVGDILVELNAHPVDSVVVGLSMAKHHSVAAALTDSAAPPSGAPLLLLFGASAEFYAGQQRRAPKWMQRFGLEWLHRLARDPRRMARRYLVDDMAFFPMVWQEWRARRAHDK